MTLLDFLLSLRQHLLDALKNQDRQSAEDIFITLSMLRDISYERQNEIFTSVIVDLVDSARDIASGVQGKSDIPTEETIQALFPPQTKAS